MMTADGHGTKSLPKSVTKGWLRKKINNDKNATLVEEIILAQ
jgi:hypothetical protein